MKNNNYMPNNKNIANAPPEDVSTSIEFNSGDPVRDITMFQLHKVMTFANCEFRGGFYNSVTSTNGVEKEIYVQDSREVFCNAVLILSLFGKSKFDDTMLKEYEIFKKNIKTLEKDFISKSSTNEEVVLGDSFYEEDKDKILLETYKNKKLEQYLNLFASLCCFFIKRNFGYMKGGSFD